MSRGKKGFDWDLFIQDPSEVNALNNQSFYLNFDKLYTYIYSLFKFENFPEEWDLDYFKDCLFRKGYVIIGDCRKNGILALEGSLYGENVYGRETDWLIDNYIIGSHTGKIGINGGIVYFDRKLGRFHTFTPIIMKYAVLLANVEGSLNTTIMNSRVAHIFYAANDSMAKTYKRIYDDVSKGKPCVVINDKNVDMNSLSHNDILNVKNTYVGNELLDTRRSIMNMFLTEIGINNANTQKKERLITNEVESNFGEVKGCITYYIDTLNRCFDSLSVLGDKYSKIRAVINDEVSPPIVNERYPYEK